MNKEFEFDPLVKDIIKKRLPKALKEEDDDLIFRYMNYIQSSLPSSPLSDQGLLLFLELIQLIQPERTKHKPILLFFNSPLVKNHVQDTIPLTYLS